MEMQCGMKTICAGKSSGDIPSFCGCLVTWFMGISTYSFWFTSYSVREILTGSGDSPVMSSFLVHRSFPSPEKCSARHFFSSLGVILSLPWPRNWREHATQCNMWGTYGHKCLRIAPVTDLVPKEWTSVYIVIFRTKESYKLRWTLRWPATIYQLPQDRRSSQHQSCRVAISTSQCLPLQHIADKTQATR